MKRVLPLLVALALASPAQAQNIERPDFTFFTVPDLYYMEPTIGSIQTGGGPFGVVLAWLLNNAVGIPATAQGRQIPLSRLLSNVCTVHEGQAIGAIACPLASLYRRALMTVNSLGSQAGNLGNAIINDLLGNLGNAISSQLNAWVAGAIGVNTINAVSLALQSSEEWLTETVRVVERQVRRAAHNAGASWLAEVFPQASLRLQPGTEQEQQAEAREKVGALVGALRVTNLSANYEEHRGEEKRQGLRNQVVEIERNAPASSEVAQRLDAVRNNLAIRAEEIGQRATQAVQGQPSVRGVLVEMSRLQIDALRMQLTSEDRLVKLIREQIMAQASTNQILAAQTRAILQREMEALESIKGQSRVAAEAYAQEMATTSALLRGMYRMPVELSLRQAEMSEWW